MGREVGCTAGVGRGTSQQRRRGAMLLDQRSYVVDATTTTSPHHKKRYEDYAQTYIPPKTLRLYLLLLRVQYIQVAQPAPRWRTDPQVRLLSFDARCTKKSQQVRLDTAAQLSQDNVYTLWGTTAFPTMCPRRNLQDKKCQIHSRLLSSGADEHMFVFYLSVLLVSLEGEARRRHYRVRLLTNSVLLFFRLNIIADCRYNTRRELTLRTPAGLCLMTRQSPLNAASFSPRSRTSVRPSHQSPQYLSAKDGPARVGKSQIQVSQSNQSAHADPGVSSMSFSVQWGGG